MHIPPGKLINPLMSTITLILPAFPVEANHRVDRVGNL